MHLRTNSKVLKPIIRLILALKLTKKSYNIFKEFKGQDEDVMNKNMSQNPSSSLEPMERESYPGDTYYVSQWQGNKERTSILDIRSTLLSESVSSLEDKTFVSEDLISVLSSQIFNQRQLSPVSQHIMISPHIRVSLYTSLEDKTVLSEPPCHLISVLSSQFSDIQPKKTLPSKPADNNQLTHEKFPFMQGRTFSFEDKTFLSDTTPYVSSQIYNTRQLSPGSCR